MDGEIVKSVKTLIQTKWKSKHDKNSSRPMYKLIDFSVSTKHKERMKAKIGEHVKKER
jgi:hypothetical protein